jgi:hypothetical protein
MCLRARGPHPNDFLSWDSQVGVPKFPKLGLSQLWRPINLLVDLWLKWGLKKSCSPCWELFNGMLHDTCTQGIQGDFWILVVGSQIANLTPGPSFGHKLCFRCPNGSCESISIIYVPRALEWYNKILYPLGFDPYNFPLKIQKSIGTPTPKMGVHLGVWGFIPSLFYTLESMRCDSQASLLAHNLTSPCLDHEPKAKVATIVIKRLFFSGI